MSATQTKSFYSVSKKVIMALTGLFLIIFLATHLAGNLLLLAQDGGAAFNEYAEFMATNPVVRVLEIGLFAGFLFHIVDGIVLMRQNKSARSQKYAVQVHPKESTWFSRYSAHTGIVILVFLILHLANFFFKHRVIGTEESMFDTVRLAFENPLYSIFYVVAMFFIGFHLNHGFQSAFQTIGWRHPKYTPIIRKLGTAYAIIVPAGFAVIPLYFLIKQFI